jgi:DNA-binding beta-propeller fold protein YncE
MSPIKQILSILVISLMISGCAKDPAKIPLPDYAYNDGVLIANEGTFGSGTGTVSYINRDGSTLKHNIFQEANYLQPLGNVVQSISVIDNQAYIVVNNANRIEVVNKYSFISMASIEDVDNPRFILDVDPGKAYVSSWDGKIKVLDTDLNLITMEIEASPGQEKMLKVDNHAWILNQGGLGIDSTITIVDISSDEVIETLQVYPRPTGICEDKYGMIWVMCSGRLDYHPDGASEGHLIAINKVNYSIERDLIFPDDQHHPLQLQINHNGDVLYYIYPGGLSQLSIDDENISLDPFIEYSGTFYSFGYDPKDHKIYAADALDFSQSGRVLVFDALSGEELYTFKAGVIPTHFYFSD